MMSSTDMEEVIILESITVSTDLATKEALEHLFKELGLTVSEAVLLFFEKTLWERKLPFKLEAKMTDEEYDAYFNPANMERLRQGDEQLKNGQFVFKTMEELERMAE